MQVTNTQDVLHTPCVVYADRLKKWHITELLNGKVDAVRVARYYDQDACELITSRLRDSAYYGHYANAPKIARVGQAFFECQVSDVAMMNYRKNATTWMSSIRESMKPLLTPIDRLRVEVDEIWIPGAQLAVVDNMKLFAGLAREFTEGSNAEPHQDVLSWDLESDQTTSITNQLAANVYLATPEQGGDLLLWNRSLTKNEYESNKMSGSYGLDPRYIGNASVRITPLDGELILFNSTRVHAVETIQRGSRMSWSCFIGYSSDEAALQFWS